MKKKGAAKRKTQDRKKRGLAKKLLPMLIVTMYTIPIAGCATVDQQIGEKQAAQGARPKGAVVSEAVKQEAIQVLRTEEPYAFVFNIGGQPGVHFRILYSLTGEEKEFHLLPNGEGVIGENGMASITLKLKGLAEKEIYLKVKTSGTTDFSGEVRTTPEPISIDLLGEAEVEGVLLRDIHRPRDPIRTPHTTAVAGVRG